MGVPARGYSWRPFAAANTVSVRHGAYSERLVAGRAAEVHGRLLETCPWLDDDAFVPAVSRYLRAAAREELLHEYVERLVAERGPEAVPSRVWEETTRATRLAAQLGRDLGLDPTGQARIRSLNSSAIAAANVAQLQDRGRQLRGRS